MDVELLCKALEAKTPDLYFELREHFPPDLIEAEIELLEANYQAKFQEKENLYSLKDDKRKRIKLELTGVGGPAWFIVVGPGRLIFADRPRRPIVINGVVYDCDVLVDIDIYPEAVP